MGLYMLDDTLLNNQLHYVQKNRNSKRHKRLLKLKKLLDKKTLRHPRTQPQMVDRRNWDRINIVLYKRYGH
jgi:hypothetical protein|tara:strand:- start:146 stop:358 length:213 start_codon:yes stop_codon:yes gene_type:complete